MCDVSLEVCACAIIKIFFAKPEARKTETQQQTRLTNGKQ